MRKFMFIPIVVFMALFVVLLVKVRTHVLPLPIISEQRPLPIINLNTVFANSSLTNEDLRGQYSLLNVFGSWCSACLIEHPFFMQLKTDNSIPIYGIAWRDTKQQAQNWLEKYGNPFVKVAFDTHSETIIDLGVTGAPETFLIDPDGNIIIRYQGPLTRQLFDQFFLPHIK